MTNEKEKKKPVLPMKEKAQQQLIPFPQILALPPPPNNPKDVFNVATQILEIFKGKEMSRMEAMFCIKAVEMSLDEEMMKSYIMEYENQPQVLSKFPGVG